MCAIGGLLGWFFDCHKGKLPSVTSMVVTVNWNSPSALAIELVHSYSKKKSSELIMTYIKILLIFHYFEERRTQKKQWTSMEVKNYIPHSALQEYVFSISTVDVLLPEGIKDVVTPYPTTPFQSLMFYCNNPISMNRTGEGDFEKQPLSVVLGPQFSRVNLKVHDQLRAIRVDLLPGGMYRILGIPMQELFDAGYNALDFFGAEMRIINEQLQNIKDMEEGKIIIEKFLLNKVAGLKEILPLDSALQTLFKNHGNLSMDRTASLSCLSLRQFERKCKRRLGMNPKTYARILRFSRAYRLHESFPHLNWTEIAYKAGYYDQMHLIRDFKVFAGVNPSVIEQQLLSTPLRMQKDLPI